MAFGLFGAFILTNAELLSIGPFTTNVNGILIKIKQIPYNKIDLKCCLQMAAILSPFQYVNTFEDISYGSQL